MTTLTYCDKGHLWGRETEQRCVTCAAEDNERALELIQEIEDMLPDRDHWKVWPKLSLLRDILTD